MESVSGTIGKNLPEKKFSAGAISATVWKNQAPSKTAATISYYTISLQRSYKDRQGNWQTSNSMRINDLPKAGLVLSKAYEYLVFKEPEEISIDIEQIM